MQVRKKDPRLNNPSFQSTFRQLAAEYGIQYYLAARYAVVAQLVPVCGSLAHHSIEMLLKASLAYNDPGETIAKYRRTYGHKLDRLWREFRTRNHQLNLDPAFDRLITELDRFEDIRYPDPLALDGGHLDIGLVEPNPPTSGGPSPPNRRFNLYLPALARLVSVLMKATGISAAHFEEIRAQAERRMIAYTAEVNVLS
jgi:hypothetical protein